MNYVRRERVCMYPLGSVLLYGDLFLNLKSKRSEWTLKSCYTASSIRFKAGSGMLSTPLPFVLVHSGKKTIGRNLTYIEFRSSWKL